jgi:hypothetical protein
MIQSFDWKLRLAFIGQLGMEMATALKMMFDVPIF